MNIRRLPSQIGFLGSALVSISNVENWIWFITLHWITVDRTGFEPVASRLQSGRYTRFNYRPIEPINFFGLKAYCVIDLENRCCNIIRRWSIRRFPYGYLVSTYPFLLSSNSTSSSKASFQPNSNGLTGSECKEQGRIQCAMIKRVY